MQLKRLLWHGFLMDLDDTVNYSVFKGGSQVGDGNFGTVDFELFQGLEFKGEVCSSVELARKPVEPW